MNTLKKALFVLLALTLLCSSVPVLAAQETDIDTFLPVIGVADVGANAPAGLVLEKKIPVAEQQAALAFWDRATLMAAKPLIMTASFGPAGDAGAAWAEPEVTGPPGFKAAGPAAANADRIAAAAYAEDWANEDDAEANAALVGAESAIQPEGTSQVYTSYIVNQNTALHKLYPHRWIGRISFVTPSGTTYCSGTALSGNVMVTAAHCLYDTTNNRWNSNWVFTPAYRHGSTAPYGTFAATSCWVPDAWVNLSGSYTVNGWARHDVGVCKMGRNSANQTLNNAVGWMGYEWNASYTRHVHIMGYPFNDYRNTPLADAGRYLRTCVAESSQQTTETRVAGCNYGGGLSGSPWIVNYAPGVVTGAISGINSGILLGVQNTYGARFNSSNIVVLCNTAGC